MTRDEFEFWMSESIPDAIESVDSEYESHEEWIRLLSLRLVELMNDEYAKELDFGESE